MFENLQDENEPAKGAKLRANIRRELKGKKYSEYFKVKNLQFYRHFQICKKNYETLYTREIPSKATTNDLHSKILKKENI